MRPRVIKHEQSSAVHLHAGFTDSVPPAKGSAVIPRHKTELYLDDYGWWLMPASAYEPWVQAQDQSAPYYCGSNDFPIYTDGPFNYMDRAMSRSEDIAWHNRWFADMRIGQRQAPPTKEPVRGDKSYITDLDIRILMRDHPRTNKLTMDYEYTPEEIRTAMTLVVDKWNDTPPFINNFMVDTFPFRWAYLLGTTANLLTMAAHAFRRNNLEYQIPGGSINDQAKFKDYDAAAAELAKEFNDWMKRVKISINLSQAWGSDTQYYGFDKWWTWIIFTIGVVSTCYT